jgi:hypothetical protein
MTQKPKTNWNLVLWPILALWIIAATYVLTSEWRDQAAFVLPIFMGVAAFGVCLLNAFAGSIARRRYEMEVLDDSTTRCMSCGSTNGKLHIIDYHWYVFLIAIVFQFGQRGKFCPSCARTRVDRMFRQTVWGSLLCPPIILWAWWQRHKILRKIA